MAFGEEFKRSFRAGSDKLKAEKPGTVVFLAYASDGGAEISIVHVLPDAEAMDRHMEGVAERSKEAYQFIESADFEIYGAPNDCVLEMMKQTALLLIAVPIAFNLTFALLARSFSYPDTLRQPAGSILTAFVAGGARLIVQWWAFAVTARADPQPAPGARPHVLSVRSTPT